MRPKIIRATIVPTSLNIFREEMLKELSEKYEVVALSSPAEELPMIAERERGEDNSSANGEAYIIKQRLEGFDKDDKSASQRDVYDAKQVFYV